VAAATAGDKRFVADFNSNGRDTIGSFQRGTPPSTFRFTNTPGNADDQVTRGQSAGYPSPAPSDWA
jgi:hypothetical protein